jgi:serine/threonine protein kinase
LPPAQAGEQPPARSSTSQRRGVVRTIHGLRSADGEPPAAPPAPAARVPLAGVDADESTRPWYRVPAAHADDFAIPQTIGNYRVLTRVAEGGMGVVLKGEHTALDRLVAIKLMKPALAGNQAFATRFMREARIAAALDHPNLVTVYDASQEAGQLFMALRWMPGGDLTGLLHRDGPLPERRAVAMFTALGSAVGYLAGKGLLHRDIKPGNILLDADGTARLGDLGLARESGDAGIDADAFDRMGTPSYMPPEQLRGDADLDVRSDLYSLALTLYVALTCRQPLQGADQGRTIANVLNELPPDPRTFNPAVSEGMARLLRKALDKDRERRFASANEFIEALAMAEQGGADNELSASGVSWFGKLFAKPK